MHETPQYDPRFAKAATGQLNAYPNAVAGIPSIAGGLVGAQNAMRKPLIEEIAGQVESIAARLATLAGRLSNVGDRVMGQEIEGSGPVTKPGEAYAGALGSVQAQLSDARGWLDCVEYQLTRLERL